MPQKVGYKRESFNDSSDGEDQVTTIPSTVAKNSEPLNLSSSGHSIQQKQFPPHVGGPVSEDCCCSPKCFTTKYALASTVLTFLIFAILVLTLDLGIREAEEIGHRSPYTHEIIVRNLTLVEFQLSGTPLEYKTFEVIPFDDREQLYGMELNYVGVNIRNLIQTFDYSNQLKHLKNLTLNNIKFKGVMPWDEDRRVQIPKSFENFRLVYNGPIGREGEFTLDLCDTCVGNGVIMNPDTLNSTFLHERQCLESFIFFKRPDDWSQNLGNLPFNISVSVWGQTLLNLNNVTGEVTSGLSYGDELVRNLTTSKRFKANGIKTLRVRNAKLNVSTLVALSSTLQVLHLDNVEILGLEGRRLSSLLANFSHLKELILKLGDQKSSPSSKLLILLDDLPWSLKSLTLAHVQLQVNPNSTANLHLQELNLFQTEILNDELIDNFSKHFKVRQISWQVSAFNGTDAKGSSWINILDGISKANPDSVFLDNWGPGSLGKTSTIGTARTTLEAVLKTRIPLSVLGSNATAMWLAKTNRGSTFIENYGRLNITAEFTPKVVWFNVLKTEAFLDERYLPKSGSSSESPTIII